jgi:hypothetical protein
MALKKTYSVGQNRKYLHQDAFYKFTFLIKITLLSKHPLYFVGQKKKISLPRCAPLKQLFTSGKDTPSGVHLCAVAQHSLGRQDPLHF